MPTSLRTGIDLIEIDRFKAAFQRYDQRLLRRLFTPTELVENGENMASLAARFAVKEAVAKAFGTGIGHITWKEIEIRRGDSGEPVLLLHGAAKKMAKEQNINTWSISLSHTQCHAIAVAVGLIEST
jgi:holo-[acyl-carrier protein] synthase